MADDDFGDDDWGNFEEFGTAEIKNNVIQSTTQTSSTVATQEDDGFDDDDEWAEFAEPEQVNPLPAGTVKTNESTTISTEHAPDGMDDEWSDPEEAPSQSNPKPHALSPPDTNIQAAGDSNASESNTPSPTDPKPIAKMDENKDTPSSEIPDQQDSNDLTVPSQNTVMEVEDDDWGFGDENVGDTDAPDTSTQTTAPQTVPIPSNQPITAEQIEQEDDWAFGDDNVGDVKSDSADTHPSPASHTVDPDPAPSLQTRALPENDSNADPLPIPPQPSDTVQSPPSEHVDEPQRDSTSSPSPPLSAAVSPTTATIDEKEDVDDSITNRDSNESMQTTPSQSPSAKKVTPQIENPFAPNPTDDASDGSQSIPNPNQEVDNALETITNAVDSQSDVMDPTEHRDIPDNESNEQLPNDLGQKDAMSSQSPLSAPLQSDDITDTNNEPTNSNSNANPNTNPIPTTDFNANANDHVSVNCDDQDENVEELTTDITTDTVHRSIHISDPNSVESGNANTESFQSDNKIEDEMKEKEKMEKTTTPEITGNGHDESQSQSGSLEAKPSESLIVDNDVQHTNNDGNGDESKSILRESEKDIKEDAVTENVDTARDDVVTSMNGMEHPADSSDSIQKVTEEEQEQEQDMNPFSGIGDVNDDPVKNQNVVPTEDTVDDIESTDEVAVQMDSDVIDGDGNKDNDDNDDKDDTETDDDVRSTERDPAQMESDKSNDPNDSNDSNGSNEHPSEIVENTEDRVNDEELTKEKEDGSNEADQVITNDGDIPPLNSENTEHAVHDEEAGIDDNGGDEVPENDNTKRDDIREEEQVDALERKEHDCTQMEERDSHNEDVTVSETKPLEHDTIANTDDTVSEQETLDIIDSDHKSQKSEDNESTVPIENAEAIVEELDSAPIMNSEENDSTKIESDTKHEVEETDVLQNAEEHVNTDAVDTVETVENIESIENENGTKDESNDDDDGVSESVDEHKVDAELGDTDKAVDVPSEDVLSDDIGSIETPKVSEQEQQETMLNAELDDEDDDDFTFSDIGSPTKQKSTSCGQDDEELDLTLKEETPSRKDSDTADDGVENLNEKDRNVDENEKEVIYMSEEEEEVNKYDDDFPQHVLEDAADGDNADAATNEQKDGDENENDIGDERGDKILPDQQQKEVNTVQQPDDTGFGDEDDSWGDFGDPAGTEATSIPDTTEKDKSDEHHEIQSEVGENEETENAVTSPQPSEEVDIAKNDNADANVATDDDWNDFGDGDNQNEKPKDTTPGVTEEQVTETLSASKTVPEMEVGDDDWGDFDQPTTDPTTTDVVTPNAPTQTMDGDHAADDDDWGDDWGDDGDAPPPPIDDTEADSKKENDGDGVQATQQNATVTQNDNFGDEDWGDDWGDEDPPPSTQQTKPSLPSAAPAPVVEEEDISLDDTVFYKILNASDDINVQFAGLTKALFSAVGICRTTSEKYLSDDFKYEHFAGSSKSVDQRDHPIASGLPDLAMPLSITPSKIEDFVWDGSLIEEKLYEAIQLPKPRARGAKNKKVSRRSRKQQNQSEQKQQDRAHGDNGGNNGSRGGKPTPNGSTGNANAPNASSTAAQDDPFGILYCNNSNADTQSKNVEDILPDLLPNPAPKTQPAVKESKSYVQ